VKRNWKTALRKVRGGRKVDICIVAKQVWQQKKDLAEEFQSLRPFVKQRVKNVESSVQSVVKDANVENDAKINLTLDIFIFFCLIIV
jgi:ligand-binding sensor protein